MRRFNANKKRVLRELLNERQPTPFRSIRGFNKLFETNTNQTYNILDDLVGTVVIRNANIDSLMEALKRNKGKQVKITYLIDGNDVNVRGRPIDIDITIPDFQNDDEFRNWWATEKWRWRDNTETDIFQDNDFAGNLYIRNQISLATTQRIKQSFLDGLSHCVFTPIIKWATELLEQATCESSKKPYKSILNKIQKISKKYENGVPEEDIEELCKYLVIKIIIHYPFCNDERRYGENLKRGKLFDFTNTRLNHLEEGQYLINKKPISVSKEFIYAKIDELDECREFYSMGKDTRGVYAIYTLTESWSCISEYTEARYEFEKENGMNYMKICDIQNPELSQFIQRGTHYNTSISFNKFDNINENCEYPNMKLLDQKKAYYNFKKCKFYEGFLGKITDFRSTNKIMGVGLYLIDKLNFSNCKLANRKKFKELNELMNCFTNNNVYTSAELHYLDSYKITYKIIAGCWGIEPFHFEFGEKFLQKTDKKPYVDENGNFCWKGISYYAKTTGLWDSHNTHSYRYIKGNNEYANILKQNTDNLIVKYHDEDEIAIGIPKKSILSLSHITSFILAYQRISLMEQLMNMDISLLRGIYVDGIYYIDHEFNILDTFETKEIDSSVSFSSSNFITNIFKTKPSITYAPFREHYKNELFIGAGGNGKTHYNLTDTGLINSIYIAPFHKLCAVKRNEYNINTQTVAAILSNNPETYKYTMYSNVLIIDEVSMMSNEEKDIILQKFPNHKLIFCGDIGYQVPVISTFEEPKTEINLIGFDNISEFTTNYRCKDKKLLEILNELRQHIRDGLKVVPTDFYTKFQNIDDEFIKSNYTINDMIITGTNKAKDYYTSLFKHLNKWYIEKKSIVHNRAEIIIQDEKPINGVIRHGFTSHSIQGETANHHLYIDNDSLQDIRQYYTAISRAKNWKDIYTINRIKI